ncbi:MAG: glycoside hydrolase family 43 protein [bacterium]|nr:glycoside hydrolase family 43 protein [bacterium]
MKTEAYLFVHFVGSEDSPEAEQIYFSVSADGETWNILNNGKCVLASTISEKGVRDPYILRSSKNNKFYIIATDLSIHNRKRVTESKLAWKQCQNILPDNPNKGSKKIVVWESTDLVHWSDARLADAAPNDAGCYWAPKCIWDEEKQKFMVFGASRTAVDNYTYLRLYRSYTNDFKSFTRAELMMSEENRHIFDASIVKDKGKYYCIYKSSDRLKLDCADTLDGEWTAVDTNIHAVAPCHEGPAICKINGEDAWLVMLDSLIPPGGYEPFVTKDLSSGKFIGLEAEVKFPQNVKCRHGSLLTITKEEYNRLVEVYGTVK